MKFNPSLSVALESCTIILNGKVSVHSKHCVCVLCYIERKAKIH